MLLQMAECPPFSWLNNIPLCIYMTSSLSMYPLVSTYVVSLSWLWRIMLQQTLAYKYLFRSLLSTLWGMLPESGIAGSYGNFMFNFLRNHHTVFHSDCSILHSHQQCTRIPVFPRPHQHLYSFKKKNLAILVGMKGYIILVLI